MPGELEVMYMFVRGINYASVSMILQAKCQILHICDQRCCKKTNKNSTNNLELYTLAVYNILILRLCRIEKRGMKLKKNPWVVPFQNYVWHFRPPTKMAATAKLNLT
jgi:hypothetical protein